MTFSPRVVGREQTVLIFRNMKGSGFALMALIIIITIIRTRPGEHTLRQVSPNSHGGLPISRRGYKQKHMKAEALLGLPQAMGSRAGIQGQALLLSLSVREGLPPLSSLPQQGPEWDHVTFWLPDPT